MPEVTFEKVKSVILDQLGSSSIPEDSITPEANFYTDLGCDSLDAVEIIMGIEEAFDIEIMDEDVEQLQTVQQLMDYLKKRLESPSEG